MRQCHVLSYLEIDLTLAEQWSWLISWKPHRLCLATSINKDALSLCGSRSIHIQ